jgi:hypothetical protein
METDYTLELRLHAARWTVVFMGLACVLVVAVVVSLGLGNAVPALVAGALTAAAAGVCRVRYVQLKEAEDEALIRALRVSLKDL